MLAVVEFLFLDLPLEVRPVVVAVHILAFQVEGVVLVLVGNHCP
jgi:hypothetical protein